MKEVEFRILGVDELDLILPLVKELNPGLSSDVLEDRLEQIKTQNYHCAGAFNDNQLVGICGF